MSKKSSGSGQLDSETREPRTVTLYKDDSVVLKNSLATADEVDQKLGVFGHELVAKLEVPSSQFTLGALTTLYSKVFYVFRSTELTGGIAESRSGFPDLWTHSPDLPPGTIEVIDESGLNTLIDGKPIATSALGYIHKPGAAAFLGRYPDYDFCYTLGDRASRRHAMIDVLPDVVEVIGVSKHGTTLTYTE